MYVNLKCKPIIINLKQNKNNNLKSILSLQLKNNTTYLNVAKNLCVS